MPEAAPKRITIAWSSPFCVGDDQADDAAPAPAPAPRRELAPAKR